jgi:hypothetical protein
VSGPLNREEFDKGKPASEFLAHLNRDNGVRCAMKDRNTCVWIPFPNRFNAGAVIVVLDEQMRQGIAYHPRRFFAQSGKRSNGEDALDTMARGKIESDGGTERVTDRAERQFIRRNGEIYRSL